MLNSYFILTSLDYTIIGIFLASIIHSTYCGLIKQILSLSSCIGGLWLASYYGYSILYNIVPNSVPGNILIQWILGFILILVLTIIAKNIILVFLKYILNSSYWLYLTDKFFGFIFGILRSIVLIFILIIIATYTKLPTYNTWQNSLLRPYILLTLCKTKPYLSKTLSTIIPKDLDYVITNILTNKSLNKRYFLKKKQPLHLFFPKNFCSVSNIKVDNQPNC